MQQVRHPLRQRGPQPVLEPQPVVKSFLLQHCLGQQQQVLPSQMHGGSRPHSLQAPPQLVRWQGKVALPVVERLNHQHLHHRRRHRR